MFVLPSFIAVELIDSYCVLISSKGVYFLKHGAYLDRDAIFLEVKYDDLYHCLVSRDHGKIYLQLTKKAESGGSGVAIPGPSHQKPMVRSAGPARNIPSLYSLLFLNVMIENMFWKKKKCMDNFKGCVLGKDISGKTSVETFFYPATCG